MYSFSLPSFLKICLLDPSKQVAEVQKKVNSTGGYDYYRTLSSAITAKAKKRTEDEILDILMSPTNAAERELNKNAYQVFNKRYGKRTGLSDIQRPRVFIPKNADFSIRLSPSFSIETKDALEIYSTWAMQKPEMSQNGGAIACFIMKEAYRTTTLANSQFFLADLISGKQYSEKQIKNSTSITFNTVVATVSRLIVEL